MCEKDLCKNCEFNRCAYPAIGFGHFLSLVTVHRFLGRFFPFFTVYRFFFRLTLFQKQRRSQIELWKSSQEGKLTKKNCKKITQVQATIKCTTSKCKTWPYSPFKIENTSWKSQTHTHSKKCIKPSLLLGLLT